ncbi:MAG: hypothetical protein OXG07_07925 [Anaerolineaceae bacterium]|nr:hypothetical protein [Anaerolineaceae bacterium]
MDVPANPVERFLAADHMIVVISLPDWLRRRKGKGPAFNRNGSFELPHDGAQGIGQGSWQRLCVHRSQSGSGIILDDEDPVQMIWHDDMGIWFDVCPQLRDSQPTALNGLAQFIERWLPVPDFAKAAGLAKSANSDEIRASLAVIVALQAHGTSGRKRDGAV